MIMKLHWFIISINIKNATTTRNTIKHEIVVVLLYESMTVIARTNTVYRII